MTGSEEDDTGEIFGQDPVSVDDGVVTRWLAFWRYPSDVFDSETLLPQGLYMLQSACASCARADLADITGRDPAGWSLCVQSCPTALTPQPRLVLQRSVLRRHARPPRRLEDRQLLDLEAERALPLRGRLELGE